MNVKLKMMRKTSQNEQKREKWSKLGANDSVLIKNRRFLAAEDIKKIFFQSFAV
jgi:hypothetical protein